MEGQIGVLYQGGKQVGGVFNWEIKGQMANSAEDNWVKIKAVKSVTALSYWLIKEPEGDIFKAELFQQIRNQLVLIDSGTIKLKLPDTNTLNRMLEAPLRLRWQDE